MIRIEWNSAGGHLAFECDCEDLDNPECPLCHRGTDYAVWDPWPLVHNLVVAGALHEAFSRGATWVWALDAASISNGIAWRPNANGYSLERCNELVKERS